MAPLRRAGLCGNLGELLGQQQPRRLAQVGLGCGTPPARGEPSPKNLAGTPRGGWQGVSSRASRAAAPPPVRLLLGFVCVRLFLLFCFFLLFFYFRE